MAAIRLVAGGGALLIAFSPILACCSCKTRCRGTPTRPVTKASAKMASKWLRAEGAASGLRLRLLAFRTPEIKNGWTAPSPLQLADSFAGVEFWRLGASHGRLLLH